MLMSGEREDEPLRLERRNRVAILWMNRPHKKNAMTPAFFRSLPRVLAELEADRDVGAVVLTGAGDAFSAGADIGTFQQLDGPAAWDRQLQLVRGAFHALERAALPVIAAVNGIAYAGGTEILLFCDFVIASDTARFSFREIGVGLQPTFGLARGPLVIGPQWTKRLALTGETIDAAQARAIGLVQDVVPSGTALDRALTMAGTIAQNPAEAVRVGKRFVNRTATAGELQQAIEATAALFSTEQHAAAVEAFFDERRRTPESG
jgi:enoyl-CoA hydratase